MKKNWEVEMTFVVTVAVEGAENEEEAIEYANNELSFVSDLEMVEARCRVVKGRKWESVCRHAEKVAKDE